MIGNLKYMRNRTQGIEWPKEGLFLMSEDMSTFFLIRALLHSNIKGKKQEVHILISGACECVTLLGEKDCPCVIKWRSLR